MELKKRIKNHLKASLWALAGVALIYGGVVAMNELSQAPEKERRIAKTDIQIQKAAKPKPEKMAQKKQRPKPRVTKHNPPPAAFSGLNSALSGVDFGVPDLQFGDFNDATGQLLGNTDDVVMTDETVDVPPKPSQQDPVEYPKEAKQKGIEGYVVLSLLIRENGIVDQIKVLEASPSGIFEDAALAGVRNWVFQPARYKGKTVRVWARQKIQFNLS